MIITWVTKRAASVYIGLAISTYVSAASLAPTAADRNYVLHKDDTVARGHIWRPISTTTAASFTAGSVLFAGPGGTVIAQDNANLFWNDTTNRLGIGTASPSYQLHLYNASATTLMKLESDGAGAGIYLDKAASGNDTTLIYVTAGTEKFKVGMMGTVGLALGSNYSVWNVATGAFAFTIDASSRVGLGTGTTALAEVLEVVGTVKSTGLKMVTGPGTGLVLTSDSAGVGTWQAGAGTVLAGNSDNAVLTVGATYYAPLVGAIAATSTDASAGTRNVMPRACTVGNLRVIASAGHTSGDNVYTVFKNGVATTLTCTLTGAATTGSDTTHTFACVAGDEVGMEMVLAGGIGPIDVKHSWAVTASDT